MHLIRHLVFLMSILILTDGCTNETPPERTEVPDDPVTSENKPRTIVTTDGEIDDVDSFIRMLLYANEFEIEGLVYSSSMWHYKGDGEGTTFISEMEMTKNLYGEQTDLRWPGTEWMDELLDAYDQVHPNLVLHDPDYPAADDLRGLVRVGNIDFEGSMDRDTEGSDLIKARLLDEDTTALYLQVWGGTNTIARALKSIEDEFRDTPQWDSVYRKVCDKAIIYAILDQDATYRKYIAPNWPDVRIYYNSRQFGSFAYLWKRVVPESYLSYLQGDFMKEHILQGHGPLLDMYYAYGDDKKQEGDPEHIHGIDLEAFNASNLGQSWGPFEPYDFISEGDSPAFLHLIDVGLENLAHPGYGGWGGRLVRSDSIRGRWEDGPAVQDFNPFSDTTDTTYPQTRWVPAIQEDFAARADWCVMDYEEANHAPEVSLASSDRIPVAPGQRLELAGMATDPDGDDLHFTWWQYHEVDTWDGRLELARNDQSNLELTVPADLAAGETIHLILEVKDEAVHPMTRYARIILEASTSPLEGG